MFVTIPLFTVMFCNINIYIVVLRSKLRVRAHREGIAPAPAMMTRALGHTLAHTSTVMNDETSFGAAGQSYMKYAASDVEESNDVGSSAETKSTALHSTDRNDVKPEKGRPISNKVAPLPWKKPTRSRI